MSEQSYIREQMITIQPCPKCNTSHDYRFQIRYQAKVLLFGGRSYDATTGSVQAERVASNKWECPLKCPETNKYFIHLVEVQPKNNEVIVEVTLITSAELGAPPDEVANQGFGPDMIQAEAQEWMKASPANARDFGKTMLTMTTAAIPLFFAVLQYLGTKGLPTVVPKWVSIEPPILFLLSATAFVVALRPQSGVAATQQEFLRFRNTRIQRMNRLLWIGVGLFGVGMVVSIYIFIRLLPG